jgi:hypothetical protein
MNSTQQYFDALFDGELFKVCPLLTIERFVDFCKKRGVNITTERLLKWEKLQILTPIARIYRFDVHQKIEYIDPEDKSKGYRDLGPVGEAEVWEGDTLTELAEFSFNRRIADGWRDEGFLWCPASAEASRQASIDHEKHRQVAYYSQFQLLAVKCLLSELTIHVAMESVSALEVDEVISRALKQHEYMVEIASSVQSAVNDERTRVGLAIRAAWLCQFISDRFFSRTQTDLRRFTLSSSSRWHNWNWYEFCREWNANDAIQLFSLNRENTQVLYEFLASRWAHHDPLADWNKLVRFVGVQKRKQLTGDAALGQSLFEMAQVIRMFHREAFDEHLEEPYEATRQVIYAIPDIPLDKDPLKALELVANNFGVNPKPQLVLFVEGQTEETVLPVLFERYLGCTMSVCGIELSNLHSVNNAAGSKADGASALCRLIDHLHHHQTIAVVLMDREGNAARNIEKGLATAHSLYEPLRRVTRPDYIKLWTRCFEFDNFSDWEIAEVLSSLGKAEISSAEVQQCREQSSKPRQGVKILKLADVFKQKTGHDLHKPTLGLRLVDFAFSTRSKRAIANRPIIKFIVRVAERATKNHQADRSDVLEYNQLSGYMGSLKPGAIKQRNKLHIARRARQNAT